MTTSCLYKLDYSPTLQGERFCSNQMVYTRTFHYSDAGKKYYIITVGGKEKKGKKIHQALESESSSSSSFEGHPLQVRHKQYWGRGFILLLPQTAALPGSDAGSDVIKPASSFVIQNRQTSCSMWCPMYRARC